MDACKAYLERFKSGSMAGQVEAYLNYLEKLDGPLELVLAVPRVFWDKAYSDTDDDHVVTVRSDDRVVLQAKDLQATPGDLSAGRWVDSH